MGMIDSKRGGWRSDAYKAYVRNSTTYPTKVSSKLESGKCDKGETAGRRNTLG